MKMFQVAFQAMLGSGEGAQEGQAAPDSAMTDRCVLDPQARTQNLHPATPTPSPAPRPALAVITSWTVEGRA